ncbi:hypothetical protein MS1_63 [Streptococcus virus MS1]|nr:hypothetical protein MS1_63 [Streptococcus virus MS1]
MKVNFNELVKGTILLNKRNRKEFKVVSLNEKEQKVELLNISSEETVKVSKATFERWYSVQSVPEKEEPKEEPKAEVKPTAGPKVSKRTNRRPRPTTVVVVEAIDKKDDKEVVEIKEKRKNAKSGTPKSDTVLSLTKQLEDRIAHDFPASRRGVTQSFIKYAHQYNFVKIFQTKSKIRINVLSRAMPEEMKAQLDRIVPAKYGWPIDGFFTIRREEDLDTAMELIAYSAKGAKG